MNKQTIIENDDPHYKKMAIGILCYRYDQLSFVLGDNIEAGNAFMNRVQTSKGPALSIIDNANLANCQGDLYHERLHKYLRSKRLVYVI